MILLEASACPLDCGYPGEEKKFLIPRSEQNPLKSLFLNCVPLSDIAAQGMPKRVITFFQKKRLVSTSLILDNGSASIHLVK
jgi:hypothetical protein